MVTGIDHLVIAVPDLDKAAHELEQGIGLAVTGGGRHPGVGTANRIAFLADGSYLELIAIEDADAARAQPLGSAVLRTLEESGAGLVTYALLDEHLETTVGELQANGSSIGPARHGTRSRPDGEMVEWWTAQPETIGLDGVPFLIRHANTGAEWGPAALAERQAFVHPIGSPVVLARLDIATPDPQDLAARYARELGLEFWAVVDLAVCTVGRHVIRLVPTREMDTPAAVNIGADVDGPSSMQVLNLRINVEPVAAPVVATT
jgi:Glyoxalase-like domain